MANKFLRAGGVASAAAATVLGLFSSPVITAHAATCSPIAGRGSSLQNNFVQAAITAYACGAANVSYTKTSSGNGIEGAETRAVQFAGTDIPYGNDQYAAISAGIDGQVTPPTGPFGKPSPVATFPIAIAPVAVAYGPLPAGCSVIGGGTPQISNLTLGLIFAGVITDWNTNPVPGVLGTGISCTASQPIKLVARSTSSGTTYAFKDYLSKVNPLYNLYKQSQLNTQWPNVLGPGGPALTGRTNITDCGATTTTNTGEASCITATTGSIGYVDWSDATVQNQTIFAIDNAAHTFAPPSTGGCTTAADLVTPPSALANWSAVSLTYGPQGYGACTYTYQIAFVAPVTAGTASSAVQAQAISDFICFEVGAGQAQATPNHYDPLPATVAANMQRDCALVLTTN